MLADPKDADGYCASLEALGAQLLERTARSGGVALATSSVTFHHLPSEAMRRCVYAFLYRVLGERGTAAWYKLAFSARPPPASTPMVKAAVLARLWLATACLTPKSP